MNVLMPSRLHCQIRMPGVTDLLASGANFGLDLDLQGLNATPLMDRLSPNSISQCGSQSGAWWGGLLSPIAIHHPYYFRAIISSSPPSPASTRATTLLR